MNDTSSMTSQIPAVAEPSSATVPQWLEAVTVEQVADAIRAAGGAVTAIERDGSVLLHSASHGVGFQVLWGSRVTTTQYTDFTLSCPLRVQGGVLPEALLGAWHRSKRFARVAQHGDFVVLEMDVMVAGGVTPAYLAFNVRLWMQMMGEFFLHLRNHGPDAIARTDEVAMARTEGARPGEPAAGV